ncbi:hypothetical protein EX462_11320 [Vibrio alginolyticus]|nr:hypothetical protein [Vibrio alginolyticus]
MSKGEKIIYLEASDHMITDEAKRHKLALMLVCSFVLMISYYDKAKVGSLFGIIKFDGGHEIPVVELIPFALIVMLYHGVIYAYHYREAIKAWVRKNNDAIIKKNISEFSLIGEKVEKEIESYSHSELPDCISSNTHLSELTKVSKWRATFTSFYREREQFFTEANQNKARRIRLTNIITNRNKSLLDSRTEFQSKHQSILYEDSAILRGKIDELLTDIGELDREINNYVHLQDKVDVLSEVFEDMDVVVGQFDDVLRDKYNHYLISHIERQKNVHQNLINLVRQREDIVNTMKELSFDEKKATLLYKYLPLAYFSVAMLYGLNAYISASS